MKKHSADARKILALLLRRYRHIVAMMRHADAYGNDAVVDYYYSRAEETWDLYVAAKEALDG